MQVNPMPASARVESLVWWKKPGCRLAQGGGFASGTRCKQRLGGRACAGELGALWRLASTPLCGFPGFQGHDAEQEGRVGLGWTAWRPG